jgi:creatinine amidohydrolase/Fe(II)-dependent formamide hydrolase-like protein
MNRTWFTITAGLFAVGLARPAEAQTFQSGYARVKQEADQAKTTLEHYYDMKRPIEAGNSVWISKLTWMEVRDAIAEGKTTVIIPVGAVDQDGPFLVMNKHEVTLGEMCEGIARALGNVLCAPILDYSRQGGIDPPTGEMRFSGVMSLRAETFAMVMDDISSSLRQHGFTDIFFITDKGTNAPDLRVIAKTLNERWKGVGATAYYLDEQYTRENRVDEVFLKDSLGIVEPKYDGYHDDLVQTALLLLADPANVRYDQRAKAGLLSINGINIKDQQWVRGVAQKLLAWRVRRSVAAIKSRLEQKPKPPAKAPSRPAEPPTRQDASTTRSHR